MPRPAPPKLDCSHFGVCGGCSLLDQPIRWQLHDKIEACEQQLAPFLDGIAIRWQLPERPQRHFRTRLLYPVQADPRGRPQVGMYEFRSHRVVAIEECRTQDVWLTELGREAHRLIDQLNLVPFRPERGTGAVKGIWARLASGTGEVLAGIVTRPGEFADGKPFASALAHASKSISSTRPRRLVGVMHSISQRDDRFLLGDRHLPLLGRDHITDQRDGLSFRISAGSFYQIHAGAHALLYRPALALCGDVTGQTVVDGYGGVGAFGLRLRAAGAARVIIVEDNASACRDAEHNSRINELTDVDVQRASFPAASLPDRPDLVVVDPPRAGLQPAGVECVLRSRPARLLYVSCSATSLASDLAALSDGGYRVVAAQLCDLFPHTEHVELLILLEPR